MKIVIMLGAPGSGKGTQAVRLSKELNIPHISTGDLFREHLKNNSELGKIARSYIDFGRLVPDALVLEMLFDRVKKSDCAEGYLLDGFPRTIPQAQSLDELIRNQENVTVVNLKCKDETVIQRISGRQTCKNCGAIYNKYFSPSKNEPSCDKCGGELIQRVDDSEDVVKERLRVYKTQTEPLIEYYQNRGLLKDVEGENGTDLVYQDLLKAVMA